jgi:hypothetical protein
VSKCVLRWDTRPYRRNGILPGKTAKGAPRPRQPGDLRVLWPKASSSKASPRNGHIFRLRFQWRAKRLRWNESKAERIIDLPAWQHQAGTVYSRFSERAPSHRPCIRSGATPYGHRCQQPHDGTSAASCSGHRGYSKRIIEMATACVYTRQRV